MIGGLVPAGTRAIGRGGAVTVAYLVPVFLVGALSIDISGDLSFGATELGVAVASYWGAAALLSPPLGTVADRLGAVVAMRIAMGFSASAALAIALFAEGWLSLAFCLGIAGVGLALGQPAANRLLSGEIPPNRLGTAFGLKQSAPPLASVVAGLSVPIVAAVAGWRPAFVAAAFLAGIVAVGLGRSRPMKQPQLLPARSKERVDAHGKLLGLAIAFSGATAAISGVSTFFVGSAVDTGMSATCAGLMLAVASGCSIIVRIGVGIASDHAIQRHFAVCGLLLGLGSLGLAGLASGNGSLIGLSVIVALAGAWGFPGVIWFAVIRLYPLQPGRVTGLIAPGALLGGTLGPMALGATIDAYGYRSAWLLAAAVTAISGVAIHRIGGRLGSVVAT